MKGLWDNNNKQKRKKQEKVEHILQISYYFS